MIVFQYEISLKGRENSFFNVADKSESQKYSGEITEINKKIIFNKEFFYWVSNIKYSTTL